MLTLLCLLLCCWRTDKKQTLHLCLFKKKKSTTKHQSKQKTLSCFGNKVNSVFPHPSMSGVPNFPLASYQRTEPCVWAQSWKRQPDFPSLCPREGSLLLRINTGQEPFRQTLKFFLYLLSSSLPLLPLGGCSRGSLLHTQLLLTSSTEILAHFCTRITLRVKQLLFLATCPSQVCLQGPILSIFRLFCRFEQAKLSRERPLILSSTSVHLFSFQLIISELSCAQNRSQCEWLGKGCFQ